MTAGRERYIASVLPIAAVLAMGALVRVVLVWLGAIDFTSDEAVVALMARHITQGRWPVFYYGEAYVGSLGATVMAGAFQLVGESVATARAVQGLFFAGTTLFTWLLAQRLFGRSAALAAGLLMAIAPATVVLYTTAGIGAYGETLLFGSCLLWLGHHLAHEWADRPAAWLAWGSVAGLGFWSLGLIVVYVAPVALLLLLRFDRRRWPGYLLAVAGFVAGSSPWWIYDLTHGHAALRVLYDPARPAAVPLTLLERFVGFLFLGIPALIGLRFSWAAGYVLPYLAPLVVTFYAAAAVTVWRQRKRLSPSARSGAALLLFFVAGFLLFFAITRFGIDSTGRYLLPLYPALCIVVGGWWSTLAGRARAWGALAVGLILLFNLAGLALATAEPAGLTTQFNPELQFGNRDDRALIDYLERSGTPYGYSHHWISFKIAFLSQEQVILAPLLPTRINVLDDPDRADRYPPYTAVAHAAPTPVYVTQQQPWLDELLRERLAAQGVTFEETGVGAYHVFYHLSRPVGPEELGPLFAREQASRRLTGWGQ